MTTTLSNILGLRQSADLRTMFYMSVTTALLVLQWTLGFNIALFLLSLFMATAVAVIAHNHNHVPTFKSKGMNTFFDYWITLFYGFPAFAWIPTHNRNHHQLNNREGDHTITYRVSERNNLFTLVIYPTISAFYQQQAIFSYLKDLRQRNPSRFWESVLQYVALGVFVGGALFLDWQKAVLYIIIPQQVALYFIMIFNYVQHVHADEESEWNHSRNFVGAGLNTLLFNNGFHTIHHDRANIHWSQTPEAHRNIVEKIDPVLNERSFWWYMVRVYFLAPLFPRFATHSMRLDRKEAEKYATTTVKPMEMSVAS
ncbi:MAG: fatty acid desaturase [Candidatus Kapabacteria bacterium]|nr:fatty acid desaturase [Candidatus Kapabacteria bacterium]